MQQRSTLAVVVTALLACLVAGSARAGAIIGKVAVGAAGLPGAVVSLEQVPGNHSPPMQRAIINQRNKTFVPHVTAVTRGSVVEFVSSDDFLHNTFSRSKTRPFNVHQPRKGSRSLVKVDQPGVIEVRCHIHGQMQAWIVVLDNPYFAVTDSRGLFQIESVPPGTYRIKSWSEYYGTLTEQVRVTEQESGKVIFKYAGK